MTTTQTDNDLRSALTTCWKDNHRKLYFCAYSVLRDFPEPAEAARDIVSDAFVKALQGGWRDDGANLYTFLYTVTRNTALDRIRSHDQSRRMRGGSGQNVAPCADAQPSVPGSAACAESKWLPSHITPRPFPGPEAVYMRKERRGLVKEALEFLTPRQEHAWTASRFSGLTTGQVAIELATSQPTASRLIAAAQGVIDRHVAAMTA
jgi:RNA polymerase sigma factor (sigma-70 family)